jgi:predicted signal transduction protein with EAL and GGDEF domain
MVISIARELEHEVIAEGVETAEQLAFLRDNGCDAYQGYYCSPPVPAAAIPELLRRTRKQPRPLSRSAASQGGLAKPSQRRTPAAATRPLARQAVSR